MVAELLRYLLSAAPAAEPADGAGDRRLNLGPTGLIRPLQR